MKAEVLWQECEDISYLTEAEVQWHQMLALVLQSTDTLSLRRGAYDSALHLQFVRFLVNLPSDGLELSRKRGFDTLWSYCISAIVTGYLDETYDTKTGRRIIRPSEKLDRLLVVSGPLFDEREAA